MTLLTPAGQNMKLQQLSHFSFSSLKAPFSSKSVGVRSLPRFKRTLYTQNVRFGVIKDIYFIHNKQDGILYFKLELGASCVSVCVLKFAFTTLYLNSAEFVTARLLPLPPLAAGQHDPGQDSAHQNSRDGQNHSYPQCH